MEHDLELLGDGDMTMIGERGINLSGGQKQRVSLARAAYSSRPLVIMDDPLSALDPEVSTKVFEKCIAKRMEGRTRILVTNQMSILKQCDAVIALEDGKIVSADAAEIMADIIDSERRRKDSVASQESVNEKSDDAPEEKKEGQELMEKEERARGAVPLAGYVRYLKAGGGLVAFAICYLAFMSTIFLQVYQSFWVSNWSTDATPINKTNAIHLPYTDHSKGYYLGGYAILATILATMTYTRTVLLARIGVSASKKLHADLTARILRAPTSFFDTTPTGRIVSRFSKDVHSMDEELSNFFDFFLFCSLYVVATLATIGGVTPYFLIAVVPILVVYIIVMNRFRNVSRESKRLESVARSPVYAHFSETLGGLSTIRAYGATDRFLGENEVKIDKSLEGFYAVKIADRWLSVRLEMLGTLIGCGAAIFAVAKVIGDRQRGEFDLAFAGLAGVSLQYAISVTGILNWTVRSFGQLESAMNAVERIFYYTDNVPNERYESDGSVKVPAAWPSEGKIVIKGCEMRYREDTPLVLKGLNLTIEAGSRVGFVGRTGSGKSSLFLTLLRIVEPERAGSIFIDGVDVSGIPLNDLRRRVGIIPQSPVLFSGDIRGNMDPFGNHTDGEIWEALDKCGMKSAVEEYKEKLSAPVAEYGENLSQGQRQLLCLGRALLSQCRILLLDEATSSVDHLTDKAVQKTLRESFVGCTILTIAHRINTIIDSDVIVVLGDGQVVETGSPSALLEDETSQFFSMRNELKE